MGKSLGRELKHAGGLTREQLKEKCCRIRSSVPSSYTKERAETTHKGSRKEKTWEVPLDLLISWACVNFEYAVSIKECWKAEYRN